MKNNTETTTPVKGRLKKKLEKDNKWGLTRSTVNHIVNYDLRKDDISSTDEFLDYVIPGIATYNPNWEGIRTVKDLKNSEVLKGLKQHLRNLKKDTSNIQDHIDAEITIQGDITESEEPDKDSTKAKEKAANAAKKYVLKGPEELKNHKDSTKSKAAKEEPNQSEDQQDGAQTDHDILAAAKAYSAKHITLINNEIELEDAVVRMKACRAKLKSAAKRVDELKKLRYSLMVNPDTDSE